LDEEEEELGMLQLEEVWEVNLEAFDGSLGL
jgi:hypothetical protein